MKRIAVSLTLLLCAPAAATPPSPDAPASAPDEQVHATSEPVRTEVFRKGEGQVVVHTVTPAAGSIVARCDGEAGGPVPTFVFSDEPSLILDFERPTGKVVVEYATEGKGWAAQHITFRSGDTRCWPLDDDSASNFAASRLGNGLTAEGPYEVRLGYREGKPRPPLTVVVREKDTKLDPLSVVVDAPTEVAYEDRRVDRWVPLIELRYSQPEDLSIMFARLPSSLWSYAKYDFDGDVVTPLFMKSLSGQAKKDYLAQLAYPKKDEPLLWGTDNKGTYIITADGLRFRLKARGALVEAPSGEVVVPTAMRNLDLDLERSARHASPALMKRIDQHRARAKKGEACWFKAVKAAGGFVERGVKMYEVTYRNGEVVKVEDYGSKASRRATAKCGIKRIQTAEAAVLRALTKEYLARGGARLAAIAAKAR